jgi:RNA polymerase sigma-70 factor (ECF subfamily)
MQGPSEDVPGVVDHLFRQRAGQVVSTLIGIFGPQHLQLAEDVVQETLLKALQQWPYRGVPENPGAWITLVAKNQALDVLRRDATFRQRSEHLAQALERMDERASREDTLESELYDDQLRMIFTCCHPAISLDARVALTLKTVGGFGVPEIARAFLVSESTITQRLVRAKRTLRQQHIPFEVPSAAELGARLGSVLAVLYGLFNEGYGAHQGEDLIRHELCAEAIRLTSLLSEHPVGDKPAVHALLALMLLQAARLPARTDEQGNLLLLEEQNRNLWDQRMILAGLQQLARSAYSDEITPYHLEAGIAATHAVAPSYADTDWPRILSHYDALLAMTASPVVALNRTVALAMVHGPQAGLAELANVQALPGMASYYLLHATSAALHQQIGNGKQAAADYERALALTANDTERRFLERKRSMIACRLMIDCKGSAEAA